MEHRENDGSGEKLSPMLSPSSSFSYSSSSPALARVLDAARGDMRTARERHLAAEAEAEEQQQHEEQRYSEARRSWLAEHGFAPSNPRCRVKKTIAFSTSPYDDDDDDDVLAVTPMIWACHR